MRVQRLYIVHETKKKCVNTTLKHLTEEKGEGEIGRGRGGGQDEEKETERKTDRTREKERVKEGNRESERERQRARERESEREKRRGRLGAGIFAEGDHATNITDL
jgi:hypothetical protein